MKKLVLCVFSGLFLSVAGCGGAVDEIPPGEGGTSVQSPEEIKKQMEESMKKSGGKYGGGKIPESATK
jgi:hypothetical protein